MFSTKVGVTALLLEYCITLILLKAQGCTYHLAQNYYIIQVKTKKNCVYGLSRREKLNQLHYRDNHSLSYVTRDYEITHSLPLPSGIRFAFMPKHYKNASILVIFPSHIFMYLLKSSLIICY